MMIPIAMVVLLALPTLSQAGAAERLLTTMVFNGCELPDPNALPQDVQARAREYAERCRAFHPMVPSIPGLREGERMMTDTARRNYERRLWSAARGAAAGLLAARYVEDLNPCYEWEGYHDCPEAEAVFAERYLADHPTSPFADYLPLLAAHRWQCAADAYEYESSNHVVPPQGSVGVREAQRRGHANLEKALRSSDPLVRFAAETLQRTHRCV